MLLLSAAARIRASGSASTLPIFCLFPGSGGRDSCKSMNVWWLHSRELKFDGQLFAKEKFRHLANCASLALKKGIETGEIRQTWLLNSWSVNIRLGYASPRDASFFGRFNISDRVDIFLYRIWVLRGGGWSLLFFSFVFDLNATGDYTGVESLGSLCLGITGAC